MSEKHPDPARSPAPPDEFDVLTVHEVAAMLRVSTMTVYRLVDSRGYPHGAVGTPYAQPGSDNDRGSPRLLAEQRPG
jgi:excisionase family DNA binding protein